VKKKPYVYLLLKKTKNSYSISSIAEARIYTAFNERKHYDRDKPSEAIVQKIIISLNENFVKGNGD